MAGDNVAVVEAVMSAFHARDVDAFVAVTTADVEWTPVFAALVEGSVYHGREGIEAFFAEVAQTWEEFRPMPQEYRDFGPVVLGLGRLRTRGRGSGVPIDEPWGGVFDFRGREIAFIRTYLDHDAALAAAESSAAG